jgi:hypothetical protein
MKNLLPGDNYKIVVMNRYIDKKGNYEKCSGKDRG